MSAEPERRPIVSRFPYFGYEIEKGSGRVWHVERWVEKKEGAAVEQHRETEVQPFQKANGPLQVVLIDAAGVRHTHRIAHLLAKTWATA